MSLVSPLVQSLLVPPNRKMEAASNSLSSFFFRVVGLVFFADFFSPRFFIYFFSVLVLF